MAAIPTPTEPAATTLSTGDFHATVHQLSPRVAVFDCDGTLWSGDAGSAFMRWTIDKGLLSRDATDWLDRRYRGYLRGEVSELAICGEMVQIYHGLRCLLYTSATRAARDAIATGGVMPTYPVPVIHLFLA